MENRHKEYKRVADNHKTVCLMVHGIVGTPRFFDNIIPLLPPNWSIYNILLDGHGKAVSDFCHTSMKKWKEQVKYTLKSLAEEYEEIIIFAHSMGTLLCMEAAEGYRHKVKRMVLFAVPLCPCVKMQGICISLKVIFEKVNRNSEIELTAQEQYSVAPDWKIWHYVGFAPRYIELLSLCRKMRQKVEHLMIPATVFMSGKDETVSEKSWEYLLKNPHFTSHCLDNSCHNWFDKRDFEYVAKEIKKVLDEL